MLNLPDVRNYPGPTEWAVAITRELSFYLESLGGQSGSSSGEMPGTGKLWFGDTVPDGWLWAVGQLIPDDTYPALTTAFGTKWNQPGDPAGFIRLPDGRNRVLRGAATDETYGGSDSIELLLANLPELVLDVDDPGHDHSFAGTPHTHAVSDPGHTHGTSGSPLISGGTTGLGSGGVSVPIGAPGSVIVGNAATNVTINNSTAGGTVGTAEAGLTITLAGEGTPVDTVPAWVAYKLIIKT